MQTIEKMERETGIEPATNSLEGCDSTTELLPLNRLPQTGLPSLRDSHLRRQPTQRSGLRLRAGLNCFTPSTCKLG